MSKENIEIICDEYLSLFHKLPKRFMNKKVSMWIFTRDGFDIEEFMY